MSRLYGMGFTAFVTCIYMLFVYCYCKLEQKALGKGRCHWEKFMNNDGLALIVGLGVVLLIVTVVGLFALTNAIMGIFGGGL